MTSLTDQRDVRALQVLIDTIEPQPASVRTDTIVQPDLGLYDVPSPISITTCTDTLGNISGMQVFYGTAKQVAGASHGDLSTTCTNTPLQGPVIEIEFYKDALSTAYIEGMVIKTQNMLDIAYSVQSISAGRVNQVGQKRYRIEVPYSDSSTSSNVSYTSSNLDRALNFFGFESTTDLLTNQLTDLKVLFARPADLFKCLSQNDISVSALNAGLSTGNGQKAQTTTYALQVIQNKQLGNLEVPTDLACINCKDRPGSSRKTGIAVAFLIIGIIALIMALSSLLAMCMMKKRMSGMMGGNQTATVVVQNNSFVSNVSTPNQAKLDDIM